MKKEYQSKYQSKLRKAVIVTATGLALLVGSAGLSGCNSTLRELNRTEKLDKMHESHTDKYFRNSYNSISLDKLTESERKIFEKADIKDMPEEHRDFVSKHLKYVNLKQPSSKDFAFLVHYGELIDLYMDYKSIDTENLSPYEIDIIKKFRQENPSGKLSPSNGTTDEKELLEFLSIFVNPENMSDRDIIFSDRVVGSIAAGMMQNMGN